MGKCDNTLGEALDIDKVELTSLFRKISDAQMMDNLRNPVLCGAKWKDCRFGINSTEMSAEGQNRFAHTRLVSMHYKLVGLC